MTTRIISEKWLFVYLGNAPFQCDMTILEAIYLSNPQTYRRLQLEQFFDFLFNNELVLENIESNSYKLLEFDGFGRPQADIQINENMVCTVQVYHNSYKAIVCRLVVRIEQGSYIAYFQTFIKTYLPKVCWNRTGYAVLGLSGTDVLSIIPQDNRFNSSCELAREMMNEESDLMRHFYPNPDVEQFKAKFFDGDPHLSMLYGNEKPNLIRILKYFEK